jgi:hypothetical protein
VRTAYLRKTASYAGMPLMARTSTTAPARRSASA